MEKFMTGKNKYVTLIFTFLIVAVFSFIMMSRGTSKEGSTEISQSKFPVVNMVTESGTPFNVLNGYVSEMSGNTDSYPVSPLTSDRKLLIEIATDSSNIVGLTYKIRDLRDMSLVEKTEVTEYSINNGKINMNLNIKNLIDDNTEYLCEIELNTDSMGKVIYYTKIIRQSTDYIQQQIDFILQFNEWCFGGDMDNLTKQLESKYGYNTTDYGNTSINSSKAMVTWGAMSPILIDQLIPEIVSVDGSNAVVKLNYRMTAENDVSGVDTFYISENYDVTRNSKGIMYLMKFARTTNQIFDGVNDLTSTASINMGINSSTVVDAKVSENNDYMFFANQGNLWGFSSSSATFVKAFSFDSGDGEGYLNSGNKHKVNILDVTDSGDCTFMVYGYMNRGEHEGKVGISLFKYTAESNETNELSFMPISVTYEQLDTMIGEIEYLDENNVFYFKLGSSMFAIDSLSGEVMTEASGLTEGNYAVSDDKAMIAFATKGSGNEITEIKVINIVDRTNTVVYAPAGAYLKVIGFVADDFVYGVINQLDLAEYPDCVLMTRIEILNPDFSIARIYDEAGVFITEASTGTVKVSMSRATKNDDGSLSPLSDDQLINKNGDSTSQIETSQSASDNRLKELYLTLKTKASSTNSTVKMFKSIVFTGKEIDVEK